jgi:transcriptional regulator with XRE-family HTH domain
VQNESPLRIRRLAAGLSQQTLATQAGCSIATIRLVEYGFRCSDGMAARIAAALNIEPTQLFEVRR